MRYKILLVIIAIFSWMARSEAATYNAATLNRSDMQAAINLTVNGDTVVGPAGTVHYTTNLFTTNAITVLGAGIGQSIIIDDIPATSTSHLWIWTTVTNGLCRLSGFQFQGGTAGQTGDFPGCVFLNGTCWMFREDNCMFTNINDTCNVSRGWINGVADHTTNYLGFRQFWNYESSTYGGVPFGDYSWADTDQMGTTNEFYIETSAFTEMTQNTPGAIDVCGGGRMVVRNNVFTNCTPTTHGTDSTGRSRSVRVYELYNNFQVETVSGNSSGTGTYRGGTGVVFGNTWIGPDYAVIFSMSDYREIYHFNFWNAANGTNAFDNSSPNIFDFGTHTGANGATVLSDTTKNWTVNQWIGYMLWGNYGAGTNASVIAANTANTITYRTDGTTITGGPVMDFRTGDHYQIRTNNLALDQPGAGMGLLLTTGTPDPNSNPIVATNLNQSLSPIYYWSNTLNGVLTKGGTAGQYNSIVEGTHFFNGIVKPGYTPLIYPHPLVQTPQASIVITIPGTPISERNIKTNGTYAAFIINNGGTTNLSLFCYNRLGNTSTVKLSGTGITPLTSPLGEIAFTTNGNICLLATGNGVKTGRLWEWSLDNPGGLPQNATLVTTFDLGATNVDSPFMVTMKNGAVAGGFSLHQSGNFVFPIYRFGSTGVWTNYGQTDFHSVLPSGLQSTFLSAAEQPIDNSLFVFKTEDGGQVVNVCQFAVTNGLTYMTNGVCAMNFLTNGVTSDPHNEPYGEICTVNPLSNWRDTNIVIAFNNNNFNGTGFNFDRATQMSVTSVGTNNAVLTSSLAAYQYSHTVLWFTTNLTNQIVRESSSVMPTIYPVGGAAGANLVTLRWLHYDTNNQTGTIPNPTWPIIKQSNVAGVEQTPSPPIDMTGFLGSGIFNVSQYFPYNGDFTYDSTTNVWKLVIDPSTAPPAPGTGVVAAGNLKIVGNANVVIQ